MPLPWLIGAAVVGLGAAIVAAVSDDDKPSGNSGGSNNNDDEERRRREKAAAEQRRREAEEKRVNARGSFAGQGDRIGAALTSALDQLAYVHPLATPSFAATLGAGGCSYPVSDEGRSQELAGALRAAFPDKDTGVERIVDDLGFHGRIYHVHLRGDAALYRKLAGIEGDERALQALEGIERQLLALKAGIGETA